MNQEKEKFQLRNWELVSINPNNRNWLWSDYFNFWAVSIQSIIGFSLIASFYLLYDLNSIIVLTGCLAASFLVFIFANIIGKISQNNGLPFPVILRLSMGFKRYLSRNDAIYGSSSYRIDNNYIISENCSLATNSLIWTVNYICLI